MCVGSGPRRLEAGRGRWQLVGSGGWYGGGDDVVFEEGSGLLLLVGRLADGIVWVGSGTSLDLDGGGGDGLDLVGVGGFSAAGEWDGCGELVEFE